MLHFKVISLPFDPISGSFVCDRWEEFFQRVQPEIVEKNTHFFEKENCHYYVIALWYRTAVSSHSHNIRAVSQPTTQQQTSSPSSSPKSPPEIQLNPEAQTLYDQLRDWRRRKAKEYNTPAYNIINNKEMANVASARPQTVEELRRVSGIGRTKAEKYGKMILDIVKKHCQNQGNGTTLSNKGESK